MTKARITSLTLATLLAVSPLSQTMADMKSANQNKEIIKVQNELTVNSLSEKAAKAIILAALLEQKGQLLSDVSEEVKEKYNNLRLAYFGSIPGSILGAGASYTFVNSLAGINSISNTVEIVAKAIANLGKQSSVALEKIAVALRLDVASDASSNAVESSVNAIAAVLKPFVRAEFFVSSGFSASAGLLYSSYQIATTDEKEAMSIEEVRSLVGYDEKLEMKISELMESLDEVFDIPLSKRSDVVEGLKDDMIKKAIETGFNPDSKIKLDVVKVLNDQKIINYEEAKTANTLIALHSLAKEKGAKTAVQDQNLAQHLDQVMSLAMILEETLKAGELSREDEKEVRQVLAEILEVLEEASVELM